MAKTDPELGNRVKEHLTRRGLETLIEKPDNHLGLHNLTSGVRGFLHHMGLNVDDPSIKDTPGRVAEMFVHELCAGLNYDNFPKCTVTPNGQQVRITKSPRDFESHHAWNDFRRDMPITTKQNQDPDGSITFEYLSGRSDEMVMVDSINTVSLCEHHFQTISGVTHVAYIPGDKLLGLSKFARVVDFFARRPQVQERMTEQVYAALSFILETKDVAVQQVCTHNCMRARGVMDPHSKTTTSKMGGKFMDVPALRGEFLHGIR